jgi:hypothetical protein
LGRKGNTHREERRLFIMRRITSVVLAVATVLVLALPALAQEGQDTCDWYWDYNYVASGGWEYWCWNPTLGWWYSTDGKAKTTNVTVQG